MACDTKGPFDFDVDQFPDDGAELLTGVERLPATSASSYSKSHSRAGLARSTSPGAVEREAIPAVNSNVRKCVAVTIPELIFGTLTSSRSDHPEVKQPIHPCRLSICHPSGCAAFGGRRVNTR